MKNAVEMFNNEKPLVGGLVEHSIPNPHLLLLQGSDYVPFVKQKN